LTIEDFVPKTRQSIDGVGFLFGAGASFEAGYPLVSGLTHQVIGALATSERAQVDEILASLGTSYDHEKCTPNIEEIADHVTEYHTNSGTPHSAQLREKLRDLVREAITSIENPDIAHHLRFLEGLRRRSFSRPTRVHIITTNYDLLFEQAASQLGIRLVNGFSGSVFRFFSEKEFSLTHGELKSSRFHPDASLTINLIKLHGSVSWFADGEDIRELDPYRIDANALRCMVLPRRTKVIETLRRPYDRLFAVCTNVLGGSCSYLVSSGFSFSDQHINDTLIMPKVEGAGINLTNFCVTEPATLGSVRTRPNITHICADKKIIGGRETVEASELWKFSEFVKLF
jgi:hypothetical protein